ncbi:GNAT family N-acetyltransferase [Periweissella fabalis]|uniref:GNAT family N-acetyltransferase n=1 Tax=Periweissella fabalis TaxID=1070421 RepID=A0A7X6N278_9LACO|nr:GNAT family N-acetyltransferase [Periweissella fabalis]MCM0599614.1 GNAT family N-acetyltransferase [Periweissella fabalis]NKZ23919.1 GNAT family N-acetyltransferase [Periweissella fabalis]
MKINVQFGANTRTSQDALKIRKAVFVTEQGISLTDELDQLDDQAWHYVAYLKQQPVATARVIAESPAKWHIQRVATVAAARHQGLASAIMNKISADATAHNINSLTLGAQITAQEFYETLGFNTYGNEFIDAGILHINMIKKL